MILLNVIMAPVDKRTKIQVSTRRLKSSDIWPKYCSNDEKARVVGFRTINQNIIPPSHAAPDSRWDHRTIR